MLVYGSLDIGGMVLPGYDSGFQHCLSFFRISMVLWDCFSVLSFGIAGWFRNLGQR